MAILVIRTRNPLSSRCACANEYAFMMELMPNTINCHGLLRTVTGDRQRTDDVPGQSKDK